MILKIVAILLLLIGEALSVYSEMIAAHLHDLSSQSVSIFFKSSTSIALAGCFLVAGYMLGYQSFRNIWIVSALSITSILIMEPFIGFIIFGQLPTTGAWIGLIFGTIGFIVTFL
jgi:hypothetical protein